MFAGDRRDQHIDVYAWRELRLDVVRTHYDSDYVPGFTAESTHVIIRTKAGNATVCRVPESQLRHTLQTLAD